MMRFINTWAIYIFCVCFMQDAFAQVSYRIPITGIQGTDYFLVRMPDADTSQGIFIDSKCGAYTYDNYNGIDFALRSFPHMDSGEYVLAAADGIVVYATDSVFDRMKYYAGGTDYFGNVIALYHADSSITYYASLKKNSLRIEVGDTVKSGDTMALVGSSGVYSTFPHLHFEIWKDNKMVDPFSGNCGSNNNHWANAPVYDTAYKVIADGMLGFPGTQDTFQERPVSKYEFDLDDDSTLVFWVHQVHIQKGDTIKIQWWDLQNGDLWYELKYGFTYTAPYMYFPFYFTNPAFYGAPGVYKFLYFHNDQQQLEEYFDIYLTGGGGGTSAIKRTEGSNLSVFTDVQSKKLHIIGEVQAGEVQVYDLNGKRVAHFPTGNMPQVTFDYSGEFNTGIYFVFLIQQDGIKRYKLLF